MFEYFTNTADLGVEVDVFECPGDIFECIKILIADGNSFTMFGEKFAQYIASQMGYDNYNEALCYLNDLDMTRGISAYFNQGNPLLGLFNKFIAKCTEAGLMDRYWSLLRFKQRLKSERKFESKYFFVFRTDHLSSIFLFLFLSWIVSSLIFLIELCIRSFTNVIVK